MTFLRPRRRVEDVFIDRAQCGLFMFIQRWRLEKHGENPQGSAFSETGPKIYAKISTYQCERIGFWHRVSLNADPWFYRGRALCLFMFSRGRRSVNLVAKIEQKQAHIVANA